MNGEGEEEHKARSTGEKMYAWKSQDDIKERKEKCDLVSSDPLFLHPALDLKMAK